MKADKTRLFVQYSEVHHDKVDEIYEELTILEKYAAIGKVYERINSDDLLKEDDKWSFPYHIIEGMIKSYEKIKGCEKELGDMIYKFIEECIIRATDYLDFKEVCELFDRLSDADKA